MYKNFTLLPQTPRRKCANVETDTPFRSVIILQGHCSQQSKAGMCPKRLDDITLINTLVTAAFSFLLAAILLGLKADEKPDVIGHRDAGDRPRQRERQEDQRRTFTVGINKLVYTELQKNDPLFLYE